MAKGSNQQVTFLTTYRFAPSAQDPIISRVQDLMEENELTPYGLHKRTGGGVSSSTFYNWFNKKTRCPQFAKVASALIAMNCYELKLAEPAKKAGAAVDAKPVLTPLKRPKPSAKKHYASVQQPALPGPAQ